MTSPGSASTSAGFRLARVLVKGLLVVLVATALGVACWLLVPSRPRAWESVNAPAIPPLPLAESLKRIEVWLADNHLPAARSLKPGLDAAEIRQRLRFVPGYVPREVYTLYQWHDGQDASFDQLVPGLRFVPLDDALRERRHLLALPLALGPPACVMPFWDRRWLPVLSFQDHHWVATMGTSPAETAVFFERILEDPDPVRVQASLAAFMAEAAACFESGAFFINDEGELDQDRSAAHAIRRRNEPTLPPFETWPESLPAAGEAQPEGFRVETRTAPNGLRFTRRFDSAGRLLESAESDSRVGIRQRTTNAYDDAGRIRERRYESSGGTSRVVWTYGSGRTVVIVHQVGERSRQVDAIRRPDQRLKVLAIKGWD
jgi:cell wall assembly regulator SMI1